MHCAPLFSTTKPDLYLPAFGVLTIYENVAYTSGMDMKLELVAVPVSDVDRAKAFYTDQIGFHADHDYTVRDDLRFVQADSSWVCLLNCDWAWDYRYATGFAKRLANGGSRRAGSTRRTCQPRSYRHRDRGHAVGVICLFS